MNSHHFPNNVNSGTARSGHILDVVFNNGVLCNSLSLEVEPDFSVSPSHRLITFDLDINKGEKIRKVIRFRNKTNLLPDALLQNVLMRIEDQSTSMCHHYGVGCYVHECLDCSTKLYTEALSGEYSAMCPIVEKVIVEKDSTPWFNTELKNAIRMRRQKEKRWR